MQHLKHYLINLRDCRPLWQACLLISVCAVVWLATTSDPYPVPSSSSDKFNHIIAFTEMTLLARLGWPQARLYGIALPLLAFGLAIELVQAQLPYRDFSWADLAADAAGIAIALLPWPGLNRFSDTNRAM